MGTFCVDGCGLSEACLQLCCCQSFAVWTETFHSSYLLQGKLGKEDEGSKKKRMLAQEWISCVSMHKATWEGDRKRSGSLKMFDLYLAAPLYNEELVF